VVLVVIAFPFYYVAIPPSTVAKPDVTAIEGPCVLVSAMSIWCSPVYQIPLKQFLVPPAFLVKGNRVVSRLPYRASNLELLIMKARPPGDYGISWPWPISWLTR
jgi:hypothetical protein